MLAYHGTTYSSAQRIYVNGFLPRKPSRLVWFAASRGYAAGRAKTKARRARERAVVLTCELDIGRFRAQLGAKRVRHKNGIVAIDGLVPPSVLRCCGAPIDQPSSPRDLADWINGVLGLKSYKGVGRRHAGIERLSRWVVNRVRSQPNSRIRPSELLHMARQWMPEFFEGVEIDPEGLHVFRRVQVEHGEPESIQPEHGVDEQANEALGLLDDPSPKRRVRGLCRLAETHEPDLFDWCIMYLGDESPDVRVAALHAMFGCEDEDPEVIEPLAESDDKRVRAAALAAVAKHSGQDAHMWVARGLKDPDACVRVEVSNALSLLDPQEHRAIFEIALYDGNPTVADNARKLVAGKGYSKPKW